MSSDPNFYIDLREILANRYPDIDDGRRVARDAGLNPALISFSNRAINSWANIIDSAKGQTGRIDAIISIALRDFPGDEILQKAAREHSAPTLKGKDFEESDWKGKIPRPQLEKIIGSRSTLVSINFLEIGLLRARSVARIRLEDGSSGTGFLTAGNILITAGHVLPTPDFARRAAVQFNYQHTVQGLSAPMEEFKLSPDELFVTSTNDDWSAVRIQGKAAEHWGVLALSRSAAKQGDYVNIIQHAGGGPKQISFSGNFIAFMNDKRVQYLTDTLPGSSGSPVFDHNWNVVAVHHSGGWLSEPAAPINATYYRNEGTVIDLVIDRLAQT